MNNELYNNQIIGALTRSVETLCDSLSRLVSKIRCDVAKEYNEEKKLVQCLLQIVMCKMKTIQLLANGTPIEEVNIVDISSMITIERSLYELVFIVHNIFGMTDNKDERQILINLWKIRGLNNRQNIKCASKEQQKQQQLEKEHIDRLKSQIIDIVLRIGIKGKAKEDLEKCIICNSTMPQGYRFKKENNVIVAFEKIPYSVSAKELFSDSKVYEVIYKLLSAHAHPSYLGVLQIGEMYNSSEYKQQLKTILNGICFLSSFLISDFCKSVSNVKSFFDELPEENKMIVNVYISMNENNRGTNVLMH